MTVYCCTPPQPQIKSPTLNFGWLFVSMTSPTVPARIMAPISTGSMYDLPSRIHPRIAGSNEMYWFLIRISPFERLGIFAI